jgi:hypothetical protein
MICVLLYGWYQMRIMPYGPAAERHESDTVNRQRAMMLKDSSYHATGQSIPGVW